MEIDKLKGFQLYLSKWYRINKDKGNIGKPVRAKHFLEDLSLIIYFFEEERREGIPFDKKVIKWKREDIPKTLRRLFGLKKEIKQGEVKK